MQDKSAAPASDTPIACTLTAADLEDRQRAWLKLGKYISAAAPIPGGQAFDFFATGGLQESLKELVRLEAECCAWMSFAITPSPAGIRLAITAVGPDGERGVRQSFAPLIPA